MSITMNEYSVVRWTSSGKWHQLAEVNGMVETTGCGKQVKGLAQYGTVRVNPWDVPTYLCPSCGFDY